MVAGGKELVELASLKEVFKDETNVVYGPVCQSGPLGGDAELVALMCSGRLGGLIFFQDPMDAHPHTSGTPYGRQGPDPWSSIPARPTEVDRSS